MKVALKIMSISERELIEKEARILRALKHKHIVQLVEVVEISGKMI